MNLRLSSKYLYPTVHTLKLELRKVRCNEPSAIRTADIMAHANRTVYRGGPSITPKWYAIRCGKKSIPSTMTQNRLVSVARCEVSNSEKRNSGSLTTVNELEELFH